MKTNETVFDTFRIGDVAVWPRDIAISDTFHVGAFGKSEVEKAAGQLLSLLQQRNTWAAFTLEELRDHYVTNGWDPNLMLFGLCGVWWDDGLLRDLEPSHYLTRYGPCFHVTEIFIQKCMKNPRGSLLSTHA